MRRIFSPAGQPLRAVAHRCYASLGILAAGHRVDLCPKEPPTMTNRHTLNAMLRNPRLMAEFCATGKMPEVATPSSPLITLLASLWPRERLSVTSVNVGQDLGYIGARMFRNAEQAYRWLVPPVPQPSVASMGAQNRRFSRVLTIDDLAKQAQVPQHVADAWWRRHGHLAHLKRNQHLSDNESA